MFILAIDTSCDETSVAVVEDRKILANVIASQVELHREFGGVVPDLARRAHRELIEPVIKKALRVARRKMEEIEAIAVTQGPGLAIALEVGVGKAKELTQEYKIPLIAVNHLEGHLLANFAQEKNPLLPAMGLIVSGGHTELILMKKIGVYEKVGETMDDAAGECLDKAAKILKLGYPGGPIVEQLALKGNSHQYVLPRPMQYTRDFNFSFSGLKTAILYLTRDLEKEHGVLNKQIICDVCASVQQTVMDVLIFKTFKAMEKYQVKSLLLGGGVMANKAIRLAFRRESRRRNIAMSYPDPRRLCTDNAAMIGLVGYFQWQQKRDIFKGEEISLLDREPNLSL